MSAQTSRIQRIDVGTPSKEFLSKGSQEWEVIEVRFHDFENLTTTRDAWVDSPEFACFSHQWRLALAPGGSRESDDGVVDLYLENLSSESITIQYGVSVRTRNGEVKMDQVAKSVRIGGLGGGFFCICERSDIISNLVDGSLIIWLRLRQTETTAPPSMPFIAENPLPKTILKKFMDEESSDVVFEVSSGSTMTTRKRTKTSTTFYAHRFILQDSAPALEEISKSGGGTTPIPIFDVKPDIFRHMLYYSYGGKVASDDLKANAKEIIDASDKYGIVGLKLEAEASLVTSTTITIENVMDYLLYADSKNCALLKEATMDFLVENGNEAFNKLSFDDVPGHMMKDLLAAVNRGNEKGTASNNESDFSAVRVSALRKMLHEKGLDIDGSRETMIARLEENSSGENVA
ncbi:hypothetical protein ACHAXR_006200 [Thalassiosira sp. AJA248-18]